VLIKALLSAAATSRLRTVQPRVDPRAGVPTRRFRDFADRISKERSAHGSPRRRPMDRYRALVHDGDAGSEEYGVTSANVDETLATSHNATVERLLGKTATSANLSGSTTHGRTTSSSRSATIAKAMNATWAKAVALNSTRTKRCGLRAADVPIPFGNASGTNSRQRSSLPFRFAIFGGSFRRIC